MSSPKSARQKRRSSDGQMPSGGAGLMRFYQDASNGVKVSAVAVVILAFLLIIIVILAHVGVFEWLFK